MNSLTKSSLSSALATTVFLIAFILGPLVQSDFLHLIPGDIGDARLNNYFLENIYQYFRGGSNSLWHLGFFSPFPYVLGFSDNLFGASLIYLLARTLTGEPDTAYQLWFLFGYLANYVAALYTLRRLGLSPIAAMVGALIFAFALPVTAHADHAQLHYRFGVPLTTGLYLSFLERKNAWLLVAAGAWLVWQFYCGIYMGFFTLLLLLAISAIYLASTRMQGKAALSAALKSFTAALGRQRRREKIALALTLASLAGLLCLLFYPYLRVSQLYGASRHWGEIVVMLPQLRSYFLADQSWLWASQASLFSGIPMRHEHQMFMGAIPMLLAVAGVLLGTKKQLGLPFVLIPAALALLVLVTLNLGGVSLWLLFFKLPLASAIRAMSRIDLVMLFPVAYLAAVAVDQIRTRVTGGCKGLLLVLLPLLIFEFAAVSPHWSPKADWRARLVSAEARLTGNIPGDSMLFFSQSGGPFYADEIDAMWVSMNHAAKTLNGYSGLLPPNHAQSFGTDCSEVPKRALAYLVFSGQKDDRDAYQELMKRILPIGFSGCEAAWLTTPPMGVADHLYSAEEMLRLSYRFVAKTRQKDHWLLTVAIENANHLPILAMSSLGKPMRLSWRFLDAAGQPVSDWNQRKDLPFDIPANGELQVQIPIDPSIEIQGGALQLSMVQELVFWAHDIGVPPLTIPWR